MDATRAAGTADRPNAAAAYSSGTLARFAAILPPIARQSACAASFALPNYCVFECCAVRIVFTFGPELAQPASKSPIRVTTKTDFMDHLAFEAGRSDFTRPLGTFITLKTYPGRGFEGLRVGVGSQFLSPTLPLNPNGALKR